MTGRQRKKLSRASRSGASHVSPPPRLLFQALISALQSPSCPKPLLLKRLRAVLMCFSLRTPDSSCLVNVLPQQDICKLSENLYEELCERSQQLFSALRENSISQKHARTLSTSKLWNNVEELALLLRCCLSVLTLLSFDQNLILERTRVLLSILSKLISFSSSENDEEASISFKRFRWERSYRENGFTTSVAEDLVASLHFLQPSDRHRSLLSALLEVFADELLLEESLRGLFLSVDSAFFPGENLFMDNDNHHNVGVVLELMAAHLMLLDSNEAAIGNILYRIDGHHWKENEIPELSLTGALALLLNPIVPFVPKMLQAHLVLVVSEVMDTRMFSLSRGPDLTEIDLYLKAFERSVNLYKMHMCDFYVGRYAPSAEDPFPSCMLGRSQPSFQCCIKQTTKEKLDLFVAKLENSWNSYWRNMILESKTDMLSASMAHIKYICNVVTWSDIDDILSVLECVILKAYNHDPGHSIPHKDGGVSFQDVYLLSSILNLMGNSMFQVIWLFRNNGYTSCLHTSQDLSFQRQHNFLLEMVRCFQQFGVHLPVQRFLFERMKVHKFRHEECIGALFHFLGLLSLCFDTRFDFLVKACLSMIMVLLNLIILEEGDLVAVRSLLALEGESASRGFVSKEEIPAVDNSTQKVASTFQKIQRQCLSCISSNIQEVQVDSSNNASGPNHMESFCMEASTEETCNGEIFLKCLLEDSKKSCDFGDLVDFIELKKGKDYIGWLRNRSEIPKKEKREDGCLEVEEKEIDLENDER
ncbi:uncharacterized protein LOC115755541 isoform X2 [Rhodamnia argentea]|uniref:Uncharacterized protein LOC115755541 isoform X2 n=1 Tax=Rhodamnia argentea TaxID=178133 RepID=A0A8B8QWZ8_9MYRT|nr:uncharacterized protein LOC115755541 isoform X2 [Rhodamnia argentea]